MPLNTRVKDRTLAKTKFQQTITLLSKGCASPADFPGGQITVFPWDSALDEWAIGQKPGQTLSHFMLEILPKICDLKNCPTRKMLVGDVMTLMLVSRSIRNSGVFITTPTCPHCGTKSNEVTLRIPDDLEKIGEKAEGYPGYDEITLPESQDVVRIRPLTVGDMEKVQTHKSTMSQAQTELALSIVSVGGGTPDSLEEVAMWYASLHPKDQVYLVMSKENFDPHLSQEVGFVCDSCNREFQVLIEFTKSFFRRQVLGRHPPPLEQPVDPNEGQSSPHPSS